MTGVRPLTKEEYDDIQASLDILYPKHIAFRMRTMFTILAATGARVNEVCSLLVGDVAKNGRVNNHICFPKSVMKGKREGRMVPLNPVAKKVLQQWIKEMQLNDDDYLWPPFETGFGRDIEPVAIEDRNISHKSVRAILKRCCEHCRIPEPVSCHSFRKMYGHKVYELSNNNLLIAQAALGHRQIAATIRYLSVDANEVEKAINGLFD